jgi:colicin import membrane protein
MELLRDIAESLRAGLRDLTSQPRYLVYAVLVHVGFLLVLVLSLQWSTVLRPAAPEVSVIQATLVDQAELQRKADEVRQAEARRQAAEAERLRRQREEAEAARAREEQREQEAKQRQEQAARQQAEETRKREEQRQAEARKQQEEARRREEQKAAEAKQAEEARKREQQKAAEAKRQEEEARKRAEEQRAREAQAAAERAREQTEMNKYVTAIQSKVSRNWNKPENWTRGVACTVRVNILPGGEVIAAEITRSCGDPLFDRSVESAVLKAHILPVPSASDPLFDRFRDLEFVFKPEL